MSEFKYVAVNPRTKKPTFVRDGHEVCSFDDVLSYIAQLERQLAYAPTGDVMSYVEVAIEYGKGLDRIAQLEADSRELGAAKRKIVEMEAEREGKVWVDIKDLQMLIADSDNAYTGRVVPLRTANMRILGRIELSL